MFLKINAFKLHKCAWLLSAQWEVASLGPAVGAVDIAIVTARAASSFFLLYRSHPTRFSYAALMPRLAATTVFSPDKRGEVRAFSARAFDASLAPGSRKNFRSHVRLYSIFCTQMQDPAFPPSVATLSHYINDYVQRGNKPHNVQGILSALRRYCLEQQQPWLSYEDAQRLHYARRGLFRLAPKGEPNRAAACTLAVLRQMGEAVDRRYPRPDPPPPARWLMVIAMCRLFHDTLLRSGEGLSLNVGDIVRVSATQLTVIIRSSKCNQHGLPERLDIQDYGGLSAVACLNEYIAAFKIMERDPASPLFLRDPAVLDSPRLSKALFIATFRSMLTLAKLPSESFSGHSFRSGGATDLFHGDCRPHMLQQQGRWRSDTFWIYARDNPTLRLEEMSKAFACMLEGGPRT